MRDTTCFAQACAESAELASMAKAAATQMKPIRRFETDSCRLESLCHDVAATPDGCNGG